MLEDQNGADCETMSGRDFPLKLSRLHKDERHETWMRYTDTLPEDWDIREYHCAREVPEVAAKDEHGHQNTAPKAEEPTDVAEEVHKAAELATPAPEQTPAAVEEAAKAADQEVSTPEQAPAAAEDRGGVRHGY